MIWPATLLLFSDSLTWNDVKNIQTDNQPKRNLLLWQQSVTQVLYKNSSITQPSFSSFIQKLEATQQQQSQHKKTSQQSASKPQSQEWHQMAASAQAKKTIGLA